MHTVIVRHRLHFWQLPPDLFHAILHGVAEYPVPKYCELGVRPSMKRPLYDRRHLVYLFCYVVICVVAMLNAPGISQSAGWVINDDPSTIRGTLPYLGFLPMVRNNGNGTTGTIPPGGGSLQFLPIIANNSTLASD